MVQDLEPDHRNTTILDFIIQGLIIIILCLPSISGQEILFQKSSLRQHLFLINPFMLSRFPLKNLVLLEPERNLLFGALNAVRSVTHISPHIDGIIAADSTWCWRKWVCGAEKSYGMLVSLRYNEIIKLIIPRPVLTASRPCQTIAQIGPLFISERRSVKILRKHPCKTYTWRGLGRMASKKDLHSASQDEPGLALSTWWRQVCNWRVVSAKLSGNILKYKPSGFESRDNWTNKSTLWWTC